MKNFLKILVFSVFVSLISTSSVMAYSVKVSLTPQTIKNMVTTLGYPMQSNIDKSVPYNYGYTQIQWNTVGMSSCTCSYWDVASSSKKNCTPSGPTVSSTSNPVIISTLMPNLKAFKIQTTGAIDNYATVSCIPIPPCVIGSKTWDSGSGSWTLPSGLDNCTVKFEAWGAGAGGGGGLGEPASGGGASSGGGGGGGGGYSSQIIPVVSGTNINFSVGKAGSGGNGGDKKQDNSATDGSGGGSSSVTYMSTTVSAGGGEAGKGAVIYNLAPGAGGKGGDGNQKGGNGGNGDNSRLGGDGGGSPNGGLGGAGHTNGGNNTAGAAGSSGSGPGGGGGGGGGADAGSGAHSGGGGGSGANGRIKISWY